MSDQGSSHERRGRPTPSTGAAANEIGPIHWRSLGPLDASREWPALRAWTSDWLERQPEVLDHHVIPIACYFRHPILVSLVQSLKDFELFAFSNGSPKSAAVDYFRAEKFVVEALKAETSRLRCTLDEHFPPRPVPSIDDKLFDEFVAEDIARRRREAIDRALGDDGVDQQLRAR